MPGGVELLVLCRVLGGDACCQYSPFSEDNAGVIVLLEAKKIAEIGGHAGLMSRDGLCRRSYGVEIRLNLLQDRPGRFEGINKPSSSKPATRAGVESCARKARTAQLVCVGASSAL